MLDRERIQRESTKKNRQHRERERRREIEAKKKENKHIRDTTEIRKRRDGHDRR